MFQVRRRCTAAVQTTGDIRFLFHIQLDRLGFDISAQAWKLYGFASISFPLRFRSR